MRGELQWVLTGTWAVFGGYNAYVAVNTRAGSLIGSAAMAVVGFLLAGYWAAPSSRRSDGRGE